jgi:hypothetical protein
LPVIDDGPAVRLKLLIEADERGDAQHERDPTHAPDDSPPRRG